MRARRSRSLWVATGTYGLAVAGPALAGGTGMPWESPLQQVVQSITGPVVQAAAVIAIGLGILFGLSIAFAASTFFLGFFGFAGGAEIG
jgi:type IV secretory pathway VirB2 component (pilin)